MTYNVVPTGWPEGRPLAVCVNIMCEAWPDDAAPGLGPMGNPLQPGVLDTQGQSWARYGMTTGAYRLLDIVAEAGIPCECYASGIVAEKWPELLQRIDGDGHHAAAHSWAQNVLPAYLDLETERTNLIRGIEAFESVTGKRPLGFASPRGTPSPNTIELLAGHGFRWHSDHFDQDMPYRVETAQGPIAVVPFTMDVNDLPLTLRYGHPPEAYTAKVRHILEGYARIGSPHWILNITAHAHVFGRPAGAMEFKAAIELVKDLDRVWMTTHQQLAELVLG